MARQVKLIDIHIQVYLLKESFVNLKDLLKKRAIKDWAFMYILVGFPQSSKKKLSCMTIYAVFVWPKLQVSVA